MEQKDYKAIAEIININTDSKGKCLDKNAVITRLVDYFGQEDEDKAIKLTCNTKFNPKQFKKWCGVADDEFFLSYTEVSLSDCKLYISDWGKFVLKDLKSKKKYELEEYK